MVNFNQLSYGVTEDDGTLNIMTGLSQPSPVQFQIMINTTDSSAISI